MVRPWAAARPLAVRAASFARRVVSNPGQAPPPPMGDLSFVVHRVSSAHLAPSLVCLRSAMKPTAPLLALPCSGMKPPSPLRAMKGHFRANSNLQRCWRLQWGAQRGVQRCWRFQSWSVIASCARKSSPVPAVVPEKVRPASPKRVNNAACWCAGRVSRGRTAASSHRERVYVRPQSLRWSLISRGERSHAIPLNVFQNLNSDR